MVRSGEVLWQRAANLDNWYSLPDQDLPEEAAPRRRSLKQIMKEIFASLPKRVVDDDDPERDEWRRNLAAVGDNDTWVEFCPFVLSMHEDGWELADGDPICNWAGNTFEKVYPVDVAAAVVARRIRRELKKKAVGNA